ncbi:Disulfide bond formation protein D precursor [Mycobacteroides salmoniphilum]|uniref:Disulfide bond formation protein D n=1 Tax=Mycobacteroides salmoniphilum TaxID=404941 RepID=A0A4R8S0B5_9MYCO|nr:thioredoxin domain-containing protein [Mycobacteroides salmoniphilum]TDZ78220.1 Disulfide bond formation protein D precursor [Mycobacteroides salmoniphilum]
MRRSENRQRDIWIAGILGVVIIVLATYLFLDHSSKSTASPATSHHNSLARLHADDPMALGPVDAPVVLVIYSDYRCPFCAKFSRDTEPQLVERYVNTGKLRIEWRDLPIFGAQSVQAAKAGRAAAEQRRFWEFNRAVFRHAPDRGHAELTDQVLLERAREAAVPDLARFQAAFTGDRLLPAVDQDIQEAVAIGAASTPVFVINDKPVVGAQPLDVFVSVIEQAQR